VIADLNADGGTLPARGREDTAVGGCAPRNGFRRRIAGAIGEPYRGTIYEFVSGAAMGKGHENSGQAFNIYTAWYLKTAFDAVRRASVRKVVVKAGVKTLKTFWLESCVADHCANNAATRAMILIQMHKKLAEFLKRVSGFCEQG
jgi:hypothetical protein